MIDFHQYPYIWVFGLLYRFITSFVPVFVLYIFSVNSSLNGSVIINLSFVKVENYRAIYLFGNCIPDCNTIIPWSVPSDANPLDTELLSCAYIVCGQL